MEKKNKSRLKIILITCGALVVCTAALIGGIVIGGNIEDNKIAKTEYVRDDTLEAVETKTPDEVETEVTVLAETTKEPEQTPEQTEALSVTENKEFEPVIIYNAEIGPEHMTVEEAKEVALKYSELLLDTTLDKSMVAAIFDTSSTDYDRKTWSVNNETKYIKFDAITGELVFLYDSSYNTSNVKDPMPTESAILNDEEYYTKAEDIVERCLANGNEIESVYIDGIQLIYNSNSPVSYLVDCHVLMKTGPSYTISFAGSSKSIMRLYGYENQEDMLNP